MKQRKLDSNKHSVFLLHYHLILVIKYRKKVITKEIEEKLREIFEDIGEVLYGGRGVGFQARPYTCFV